MFKLMIQGSPGVQFSVRRRPTTTFGKGVVAASTVLVLSFGAERKTGAPRSSFHRPTALLRGKVWSLE